MAKYLICFVMALLLAACAPVSAAGALTNPSLALHEQAVAEQAVAQAQEAPREVDPWLASLWMDMSMGSQLVGLYNNYASERDMARADHVSLVDLLDKVKVGHRLVVFKNVSDIEELVPHLVGKMDVIGYNLESGPANRPDEQADPVGSIRRARAVADQYGMQLAFGPDRAIALNYGTQLAPYADIFVLQVQRVQTEPETVREFVIPLAAQLRRANPNIQISVQIRTEGNVDDLADLLISMKGSIDGVSILTDDETAPVAKSLLTAIRQVPTEVPVSLPTPTPVKRDGDVAALITPTATVRRSVVATPVPVETPGPRTGGDPVRSMLLLVGLSVMGVIISGVVATVLIYAFRTTRARS
jgi:hypothetical protein